MLVIEEWRAAYRAVLNTFQAILRNRTAHKDITVAQRHKRQSTIFDKLQRLPKMQLSRMDDVAGCRLIFKSIEELNKFRAVFHKARFHHELKNDIDKYDYIKNPKSTGYRGIHDVYGYDVNSASGLHLKGLLVEIQYRTEVQHAWATAVEVIGFITADQPKFEKGDNRYQQAMALASEIFARVYENSSGPFPELSDIEVVKHFIVVYRKNKAHIPFADRARASAPTVRTSIKVKGKSRSTVCRSRGSVEAAVVSGSAAPDGFGFAQ